MNKDKYLHMAADDNKAHKIGDAVTAVCGYETEIGDFDNLLDNPLCIICFPPEHTTINNVLRLVLTAATAGLSNIFHVGVTNENDGYYMLAQFKTVEKDG